MLDSIDLIETPLSTSNLEKKIVIKVNNLPSLTSSISNFLKNLKNNKKDILLGLNVVKILHLAEKSLMKKKKLRFH